MKNFFLFFFIINLFFSSCIEKKESKLFRQLSRSKTGIDFSNKLNYNEDFNIFTYRNYFNGGGVGIIDVNNDNLLLLLSNINLLLLVNYDNLLFNYFNCTNSCNLLPL